MNHFNFDYAAPTQIDRLAGAHQRYEDDAAEAQDRAEKLSIKAAAWISHPDNMLELSGWFSDAQYIELARLDAKINYELSQPFTGDKIRETEVGVREYSEKRREIYISCAVEYASRFNNFENDGNVK
ncbi:MAG: hypothetical protein ACYC46_16300 [Acidobacteriaceae bacterium]